MYQAGIDPFVKRQVYVTRDLKTRTMRRALVQFFKPESYLEWPKALIEAGREDTARAGGARARRRLHARWRGTTRLPSVVVLLIALTVHPGARPAGAADPILIGEIDSRTGLLASQGLAIAEGVRIAVDDVNAAGGVGGRPVRLLERDDEGKAERAIAAAEELVARHGVVALVGGYVDSLVGPVSEVAERARVPYLAAASLDERLTARGYRYFFRLSSLPPY